MKLGIDLGTYSVKICTEDGVMGNFYSKISEESGYLDDFNINYNGNIIQVGNGEFSTDWDKADKDNTLPMLFTALYRYSNSSINDVVIGLPANQYKAHKDNYREFILDNRIQSINGKQIIIEDCIIECEGIASYNALDSDIKNRIGGQQLILIDLGGRTTDICCIKGKRIESVNTIPVGTLNIYSQIIDKVNGELTINLPLEEGKTIMDTEIYCIRGREIDRMFIQDILKNTFNTIFKELQLKYSLDVGYVLLVGGGSYIFQKAFRKRLGNVITVPHAEYLNAKGFLKRGIATWQRK